MESENRFYRYEENFLNCSRIISRCIYQLSISNGKIDAIVSVNVEIEGEISEAEGYVKAMEVEFKAMNSPDKAKAQQKIYDYKKELIALVDNFKIVKGRATATALKKSGDSSTTRAKLLVSNQKLDQSTITLQKSQVLLADSETIGSKIISDLESQREVLSDASDKAQETKGFAQQAKIALKRMGCKAELHKCFMMFVSLALLAAIGGLSYYALANSKTK